MSAYKSYRSNTFRQTGKQMKQFLSAEIYEQHLDDKELAYSLVEKESERKMAFNQRLLILHSDGYLGYCSKLELTATIPFVSVEKIPTIKARISLDSIKSHALEDKTLTIDFRETNQSDKTWVIRMSSHNLGFKWENRIMEAIDKIKTKKVRTNSATKSETPRKSELKISKIFNEQIYSSVRQEPEKPVLPDLENSKLAFPSADVSLVASSREHKNDEHDESSLFLAENKQSKNIFGSELRAPKSIISIDPILQRSLSSLSVVQHPSDNTSINLRQFTKQLDCEWCYQFLQAEQSDLFPLFSDFSQTLAIKLIDEMMLPNNLQMCKPRVKSNNLHEYTFKYVTVRLGFTVQGEGECYNEEAARQLKREFRNMAYLLRQLGNQGRLRVPLSALVEYKGVTILVVATPVLKPAGVPLTEIAQDLKILCQKSHIKPQIFSDTKSLIISAVDTQYYNRLARKNGDNPLKQQLYFFTDIRNFLPEDTFLNLSKNVRYQLRPEFMERSQISFEGRPFQNYKSQIKEDYSTELIGCVDQVAKYWQDNMECVVLPKDIVRLMHSKGLGLRYLGLLYESTEIKPIKKIVMSEIVARSLEIIIRGRLCSEILTQNISLFTKQMNPSLQIRKKNDELLQGLKDIRRLLSESPSSMEALWSQIDRTAVNLFNKSIDIGDLMGSYLVMSVLIHSNMKVHWRQFELNQHMRDELFRGLSIKVKTYRLNFNSKAIELEKLLKKPGNGKQIQQLLDVKSLTEIPQWVQQTTLFSQLRFYLAEAGVFQSKVVQQGQYLMCSEDIKYELLKLKNEFRQQKMQNANKTKSLILKEIAKVYGQSHPYCWFVQDILTEQFEKSGRFQEALVSAKNSFLRRMKYLDTKHPLFKQINLKIARILKKLDRKLESIDYFKKGRQFEQQKDQICTLNFQIGALEASLKKFTEAEMTLRQCLTVFLESSPIPEQRLTTLTILLHKCVIDNPKKLLQFVIQCQQISLKIEQPQYLEQFLKIIIPNQLKTIPASQIELLTQIIEQLQDKQSGNYNYGYSANIIKDRIGRDQLFSNLRQYIGELDKLLKFIDQNDIVDRWQGFMSVPTDIFEDFLTIISVLIFFLSKDFIVESLPKK